MTGLIDPELNPASSKPPKSTTPSTAQTALTAVYAAIEREVDDTYSTQPLDLNGLAALAGVLGDAARTEQNEAAQRDLRQRATEAHTNGVSYL